MNFYLEALQDEHLLLKNVLETYCTQAKETAAKIRSLLESGAADRILFVGMGSSLYAAYSVVSRMNNAGIRTEARNCFELLTYANGLVDEKTIFIMISQSGNTPEGVAAIEKLKARAAMSIVMFNNEDCRMRGMTDMEMPLGIGKETHISNKTYYAQVAQLNILATAILGGDAAETAAQVEKAIAWHADYVANQKANIQPIVDFMKDTDMVDLLGDDAQFGAAMQAGLVIREMTLRNICTHSLSDYNHGWFEIARPGYMMVIFADTISPNDYKMIDFCLEHGGKVMILSPEKVNRESERLLHIQLPEAEKGILPLYSILPCYFIAGTLAAIC